MDSDMSHSKFPSSIDIMENGNGNDVLVFIHQVDDDLKIGHTVIDRTSLTSSSYDLITIELHLRKFFPIRVIISLFKFDKKIDKILLTKNNKIIIKILTLIVTIYKSYN